jgi:glycosyltransferase involved in cell wall biosynthesis
MKLLIITQVIDTEHPILGFFHRWVIEFAKNCEHVHVIALQVGEYNLPENVTVHSLGKDEGKGRFTYLLRFYKLIWSLRHEYDNVFVHMNQIYVILGALLWGIFSKPIGLWYAHGAVTTSLHIAVFLSQKVFTSTRQGMTIDTPKRIIVGQGIDTEVFKMLEKKEEQDLKLITVGRVSVSKNIDTLLRACVQIKEQNIPFSFKIIGPATIPSEVEYLKKMKLFCSELKLDDEVQWVGPVAQTDLPMYLQSADVFIHDGATNSLDKALLESVLCGCVVISSNPAYRDLDVSSSEELLYKPKDVNALARAVLRVQQLDSSVRGQEMQPVLDYICSNYSVSNLISGIISAYSGNKRSKLG